MASIADGGDALRRLEAARDEVIAALATMTPERFATSPSTPAGAFPMSSWMSFAAGHIENHAAQIDYLQTLWGDLVDHR